MSIKCEFNCSDGRLFNPNTRKFSVCEGCADKRSKVLKTGVTETGEDLETFLGFAQSFLGYAYDFEDLIPSLERKFLEPESLEFLRKSTDDLFIGLKDGALPDVSVVYGLGIKGRIDRFAFPMLIQAYKSGFAIAPFVSVSDYARKVNSTENVDSWNKADVCFVLINEGCTLGDFAVAKGLMQSRAVRGKATIFVTTWTIQACSGLLAGAGDASLFLAEANFVTYRRSEGSKANSSYINGLIGVEDGVVDAGEVPERQGPAMSFANLRDL